MNTKNTQGYAGAMADSLTGRRLDIKHENYPLHAVYRHYVFPEVEADCKTETLMQRFFDFNAGTSNTPLDNDEFDELTRNIAQGLKAMLLTIRTQVVPTCKDIVEQLENTFAENSAGGLEIHQWDLHSIHSHPSVSELAAEKNRLAEIKPPYATVFLKHVPDAGQLREMVAKSPSLGSVLKEWAWQFEDDQLQDVYHQLFREKGELDWSDLWMLDTVNAVHNVDLTLIGYALTDYLVDNPQDVINGGISLEEWERTLERLRHLMQVGYYRQIRAIGQARHDKRVVWDYEYNHNPQSPKPVGGDVPVVLVDKQHIDAFYEQGGSVKTLMGARSSDRKCRYLTELIKRKDELEKAGDYEYVRAKKEADTRYFRDWRKILRASLLEAQRGRGVAVDEASSETKLPTLSMNDFETRWTRVSQRIHENDLDDPWRTVTKVVCEMFYPNTPYHHYLHTMDRIAKTYQNAPPREIANLATVELLCQWLTDQVQVTSVPTQED